MPKSVAFFDFDHTLILGDSFWPYVTYAAGIAPAYAALASGLAMLAWRRMQGDHTVDARDFLKDYLIRRLLTGKKPERLQAAAAKMRRWQTLNPPIMNALREHHANGDMIVIASGGLDLYLPEMLQGVAHDALICTEIDIKTGAMINGNCVREVKAERVAKWLAANGPFDHSWAYGNYPHDVPMMAHVKHRIIVS